MLLIFFFKQKTAYELRIGDWSSDVCSSDLKIETNSIALPRDLLDKMAKAFRVPWQDLTYATDRPQLVLETAGAAEPTVASAGSAGPVVQPRFDTYFAHLARDEAAHISYARKSCVYVPPLLTRLSGQPGVSLVDIVI